MKCWHRNLFECIYQSFQVSISFLCRWCLGYYLVFVESSITVALEQFGSVLKPFPGGETILWFTCSHLQRSWQIFQKVSKLFLSSTNRSHPSPNRDTLLAPPGCSRSVCAVINLHAGWSQAGMEILSPASPSSQRGGDVTEGAAFYAPIKTFLLQKRRMSHFQLQPQLSFYYCRISQLKGLWRWS